MRNFRAMALSLVSILVVSIGTFASTTALQNVFSLKEEVPTVVVHRKASPIEVKSYENLSGKPTQVVIPELGIRKIVENGVYNSANHTWNLSSVNAHHAQNSAPANIHGGNTFIYGHNSRSIFGKLSNLQTGSIVILQTAQNLQFSYGLESVTTVQPDDVEVLTYSGPPILTIQTCSGNWNEKRTMYRFRFLHVEIPASFGQD